jgi:hypothetical protein
MSNIEPTDAEINDDGGADDTEGNAFQPPREGDGNRQVRN